MSADGKILVAGASRGIGLAAAKMLLERGRGVIAAARNVNALKEAFAPYDDAEIFACDFSDVDTIASFAERINNESGPISGLVYTAGMQLTMPISMNKPDSVKKIFALNTFAPIELIRCFSKKKMIAEQGASFVLISSLAAHEGAQGKSLYAATKGALEGFLPSAALELAQRKIRTGNNRNSYVKRISRQNDRRATICNKRLIPIGLRCSRRCGLFDFLASLPREQMGYRPGIHD